MSNATLDSLSLEAYEPDCQLLTSIYEDEHRRHEEELLLGESCAAAWDSLLCWPRTKAGSVAVQPCFDELHGIRYDVGQNASRWCWPNGTWDGYSNYSQCRELHTPESTVGENGVEITTHLYLVGYGLSLSTLIIAVIIYLYYRELRCLRNIIHTNLMFTYILADFLWIVMTVSQVSLQKNIPMCIVFYSMYHYFQLTNFFWMFVEGLYLYVLVVKTFSGDTIKLKMCLFIGWGLPFIVVVVWGMAKTLAAEESTTAGSHNEALSNHCPWMIPHPFDWLYQVPAIFVLCMNVVFLFMIMWVLITKLRSANTAETQQYRKAAKALLVLIPLLGVTYILVIAGPTEGQAANMFTYSRAILLSSQGLSVALFYCFLNSEVRNSLRHHYDRWTTERSLGHQRYYAHWTPRSRTESIRLYCRPGGPGPGSGPGPDPGPAPDPGHGPGPGPAGPNGCANHNHHNHNHNHHHNKHHNKHEHCKHEHSKHVKESMIQKEAHLMMSENSRDSAVVAVDDETTAAATFCEPGRCC